MKSEIEQMIERVLFKMNNHDRAEILNHYLPEHMLYEYIIDHEEFDSFYRKTFRISDGGDLLEELIQFACKQCVRDLCTHYVKEVEEDIEMCINS